MSKTTKIQPRFGKRLRAAQALRAAGKTCAQIGVHLGISRQRVWQILHPDRRKPKPRKYPKFEVTAEQVREVLDLHFKVPSQPPPEPAKIQPRFGQRLRAARDKTGLTQCALAAKAGVTPVYLCMLEKGKAMPSIELAAFLSQLVHKDLCCGLVKM